MYAKRTFMPTKVRLSERNPKETIKRVQKKFTFYAECEFLRPKVNKSKDKSDCFARKERKERRVLFPLVFYAGAEEVANRLSP